MFCLDSYLYEYWETKIKAFYCTTHFIENIFLKKKTNKSSFLYSNYTCTYIIAFPQNKVNIAVLPDPLNVFHEGLGSQTIALYQMFDSSLTKYYHFQKNPILVHVYSDNKIILLIYALRLP